MTKSWQTDVRIVESLQRRIEQFADNPKQRAIYETALEAMLASNVYLRPKTSEIV